MTRLGEIAWLFALLGATAFGGPAAHIAMMHEHVVRRRQWLTAAEFTDLIAAVNLIPGPNSTELALHLGRRRGGFSGFLIAGFAFILPAALIVSALAVAYVEYGRTPDARALLAGVSPVIIAIILHATVQLGASALKSWRLWALGALALACSLAGVNELLILLGAGLLMMTASRAGRVHSVAVLIAGVWLPASAGSAGLAAASTTAVEISLTKLTLFFLKVGSVMFGSGYVLLAFLRADLVERWRWLTEQQLLDAVAVGQFTPGPISTTATFIGYVLAGWPGAWLATAAMFFPAFVFVWITYPYIPKLRASPQLGAFLDGIVAGSLGLMAAVAVTMARSALDAPIWIGVCAAALVALAARVNSVWLILAGGLLGLLH